MNQECRMYTKGSCLGLTNLYCKGDYYNTEGKCPFYKDEETYRAERRHTKHRLKKMGLEHLLTARSEK